MPMVWSRWLFFFGVIIRVPATIPAQRFCYPAVPHTGMPERGYIMGALPFLPFERVSNEGIGALT